MDTTNKLYTSGDIQINSIQEDDNFLRIKGYGSHHNVANLNRQITDAKSYDEFFRLYRENKIVPLLNYEHDPYTVIGTVDSVTCDDTGLYFECSVNKAVKICDEQIIPNIKAGVLKSFSTQGFVSYDDIVENEETGNYYCRNFILTDLAVVAHPADWQSEFEVSYNAWKAENKPAGEPKRNRLVWL